MSTAGSIVVDLLARTGSFETDLQRATRTADAEAKKIAKSAKDNAKETESAWSKATKAIGLALGAISAGAVFTRLTQNTVNAANEQAQLAAVLTSTAHAAGFSRDQLNAMATSLSGALGVVSAGEINTAQTSLLAFTGIVGEQFPRALQAAIDMASRTGMSVASAAETVGRALDVPSAGLTALSRQGFRFTEDQKKLAEQLEQTGRAAEAQGMILEALEGTYGGAAQAARDTLGGAWRAMVNVIDDILTASDGLGGAMTSALNMGVSALSVLAENFETVQAFAMGFAVVALPLVVKGVAALTAAIAANPLGLLLVAISAGIGYLVAFSDEIRLGSDSITTLGDVAGAVWDRINDGAAAIYTTVRDVFVRIGLASEDSVAPIGNMFRSMAGTAIEMADNVRGAMIGAFNVIRLVWNNLPEMFRDIFTNATNAAITKVEDLLNTVIGGINSLYSWTGIQEMPQLALSRFGTGLEKTSEEWGQRITDSFKAGLDAPGLMSFIDGVVASAAARADARINQQILASAEGAIASYDGAPLRPTQPAATKPKATSAGTDPLASYRSRLAEAQELTTALQKYGLQVDKLLPSERELLKLQGQLGLAQKDRTGKVSDAVVKAQIALATETAQYERQNRAIRQNLEQRQAYTNSILDQNAQIYTSVTELQDRASTWAMTDEQTARNVDALAQARVRERIATEGQVLARQLLSGASADEIASTRQVLDALRTQLDYREREAKLNETLRQQAKDRQAHERTVSGWTDTVRAIDDVFRKGFADMVNAGEGSWKAFTTSLATTFKTTVADTLYKAFAQPFVVRVVAQMAGLISGPDVAKQVLEGSGLTGGGGLAGLFKGASLFGGGSIAGTVTEAADYLGYKLWESGFTEAGNSLASSAQSLGGIADMAGQVFGYGKAIFDVTEGNYGSAIGTAVGTYILPGIGTMIGSMLGSLVDGMFGKGETRFGGGYTVGADGNYFRSGGPSGGDPAAAQTAATVQGVREAVRELAVQFGGNASALNFAAGWELSPDKGNSFVFSDWSRGNEDLSWQRGLRSLDGVKDGETVAGEFATELQRALIRGLQMSGLERAYADIVSAVDVGSLDAAGVQQVLAALAGLQQFTGVLASLPFVPATAATANFAQALISAAGGAENAANLLAGYYTNYYTEAERTAHLTEQLTGRFAELGLALPQTRDEFRGLVQANLALGEAGARTAVALLGMEASLSSILPTFEAVVDVVEEIVDPMIALNAAMDTQMDTVRRLAQEASRLGGLRNAAGSVVDQITRALGGQGQYGLIREAEMWAQLTTASYEHQVELAGELTDIVLARYNAEIEAATRMRDLGRSLGGYLDSLRVGDLSPLTLGQRTAEAERQLMETIARAQGGDTDAMAQVQSQLEASLRLWREYGASGAEYQAAYGRLTGAAGDLAQQAMSDAERQLGVSQDTLAELEKLQRVAEGAYGAIDRQYQAALQASRDEIAVLTAMASDTDRLHDVAGVLQGLPAGIAAALQPVLSGAMGNVVSGWYAGAGYGQGDQAGRDYWTGQLGQKPQAEVQQDFLTSLVSGWYKDALGWAQPDAGGLAYWISEAQRIGAEAARRDFLIAAGINGSHRDGLWSVPFDGYRAELHRGETVLPQAEAQRYRALDAMPDWSQLGRQDNAALIAEVREVRKELAQLRAEQARQAAQQVGATVQAGQQSAEAIVQGVGGAIQQRQRDDTNNRQAQRAGIYTTT